ncbi:MFS transporter [Chromobacterium haemolyticum]|uniref:MFS transporter n=1 Tax=Chromobacterium TaxID=535 RepID=UPI0018888C8E|nr:MULTISPECIES: MFS transporter [Chromobacterium]QOZ85350.1 MFS transporter [Chromobacterium sp. Rain0013]WON85567.1 MFS transporter [Chromobacterium haemolyticum]
MIDEKEIQVRCLLASSWLLTMSRAVIAPLLVLTLGRQLSLNGEQTGLLLGGVLLLSALMGLYGGHLLDHWPRRPVLLGSVALIALNYLVLPLSQQLWWSALALALSEIGQAVHSIAIKALISDLLPPERRGKAFSLRYTLANVGWALGPLLCSLLLAWGGDWPFWCAIVLAAAGGLATPRGSCSPRREAGAPAPGFLATLGRLRQDRVLVLFTLSCALANLVYARFSSYLPLYLMQSLPEAEVLRWMSALISCNAVGVVLLQYPLGRRIGGSGLMKAIGAGFLLLGLGTLGLGWAPGGLLGMCAAMLVFTVGEIVLVPAEYLYIDAIAPEDCKGVYYGAQNLASLGGALGPMLAGWMLARASGGVLFAVMASLCMLAWWLALRGEALRQARSIGCWQAAALKI